MFFDKIIIIGSGKLAFQIANYLKSENHESIVLEKRISKSTLENLCISNHIEYYSMNTQKITDFLKQFRKEKVLIISAINTYIFPKEFTTASNFSIINYHNSLLPLHPGMNVEAWQIYEEESSAGVTWHYVTEKIDNGEILLQEKLRLTETITSIDLLKQQSNLAFQLFKEFIPNLLDNVLAKTVPQKVVMRKNYIISKTFQMMDI